MTTFLLVFACLFQKNNAFTMDPSTVHVIKNPNGDSERPIAYQTPTPTFTPPPPIVPIESPTYHTGATSSTNLVASGGESTSRKKRHSSALGEKHQQLQSHLKEHLEKFERKRKRKQSVLISEHTYLPNGNGSSNNSQPVSTGVIGGSEINKTRSVSSVIPSARPMARQ